MHSPLKTMLRKIGDRHQDYCTTYNMHAMATCHGGARCPIDRDIDLQIEDVECINTGPDKDEGTCGSDTTIAFGGSEADGHLNELIPSNVQEKYTIYINEKRPENANQ